MNGISERLLGLAPRLQIQSTKKTSKDTHLLLLGGRFIGAEERRAFHYLVSLENIKSMSKIKLFIFEPKLVSNL